MKTSIIAFAISCLSFSDLSANDGKFLEVMQKNIRLVYEAKTSDELTNAINSLERIANAEKKRWEPLYYMAFGNIMLANRASDGGKKDQYLDRAIELIGQANTLHPNDSEIVALEGFALMIKISVDPQNRGMIYAAQATGLFEKAKALNPENPRALGLLAQMEFGTAQFFNSSTAQACAINAQAMEKMETYKSDSPIAPAWGKGMIESLQEKCK